MLNIIKQLQATSKRTEKEAILNSLSGPEKDLFIRLCVATYDESISYYITKATMPDQHLAVYDLDFALEQIKQLSSRNKTGHAAIKWLTQVLEGLSEDNATVLALVIKRDLGCGISSSTINKIWPDTIYVHPYNRCSGFSEKTVANLSLPCYSQTKEDGLYIDIVIHDRNVTYMTRSGQVVNKFGDYVKNGQLKTFNDYVIMGEALVLNDDGTYMDRKGGNGYLNSDRVDPERVVFVVWDIVPYADWFARKCNLDYKARFICLTQVVKSVDCLRLVNTKLCHSVQDIIEHFKENVAAGKEGTVAKDTMALWVDGTSSQQIKLKIEFECELRIVGIEEGEGRNKGRLGAYKCESECGKIKVNVGSGISDKQREQHFTEEMVGKILTVKSNDVVSNEKGGMSLFLPRAVEIRNDKNVADTYERIIEQRDSFVNTLNVIGDKNARIKKN